MVSQMALSGEVLVAPYNLAPERFLSSMDPLMSLQISVLSKRLVALWTLVRLFPSMRSLVDLESTRP